MSEQLPSSADTIFKEWLKTVIDPELRMSIVELGLIYECKQEGGRVDVIMTLTSPGCPAADELIHAVKTRVIEHPDVQEVHVELVFEPKWDPKTMASEEAKDILGIW